MTAGAACTGAAAGEQGVSLQLPVAVGQRRPCRARLSTWFCSRCWRVGSLRLADTAAARTSFQGWPRHQQPRRLCARGLPGVQAQDRPRRARARLCAQRGGELRRCRAPRVRTRTKVQIPPKKHHSARLPLFSHARPTTPCLFSLRFHHCDCHCSHAITAPAPARLWPCLNSLPSQVCGLLTYQPLFSTVPPSRFLVWSRLAVKRA